MSRNTRSRAGVLLVGTALVMAGVSWAGDLNPPPGPIMPTNRVQLNEQAITVPHTISQPGSYVLTSNLTGVSGQHGIIIDADDVTLDLNGFALLGIGGSLDGVNVNGAHRNVSVVNGTIRGWGGNGVGAGSAINGRFGKLALSNNGDDGLIVGARSLLIGLTAHNNNGAGIHASGDGNRIEQCHAAGNTRGVDVDGEQNLIVKNSAANNGTDYDIAPGNAYGPIVSVGGAGDISFVPKADHPWANFALICPTWCQDADGDAFGDPGVTQQACTQPGGFVADCTDCDDANPSVNPAAPEFCDGQDNDCNGTIDDNAVDQQVFCRDLDGDGFGDPGDQIQACPPAPPGFVTDCSDCNDTDPSVNPGEPEQCDGQDNDCNGQVDEFSCPNGTACGSGFICQSGNCADGFCCNTACTGQCEACDLPASEGTCTLIPSGTDPDNECGMGEACDGAGQCKGINGVTCTGGGECLSGFCADGFCCDSACTGTCEACAAAKTGGTDGTCAFIPSGSDPDNECGVGACDGSGACTP